MSALFRAAIVLSLIIPNEEGPIMCQTSVVLEQETGQEKIMENVTLLEVKEDGVTISTMFDQPKTYHATIKKIDFLDGIVTLIPSKGA